MARVVHNIWMVPGLQQVAELIGILVVVKFRPVKLHGCREIVVQTLSAELVGIRCVVQPHGWCWACKGPMELGVCVADTGRGTRWNPLRRPTVVVVWLTQGHGTHGNPKVHGSHWGSPQGLLGQC